MLRQSLLELLRPILGALLLPLVFLVTVPAVAVHSAWLRVERFLKPSDIRLGTPLLRSVRRFASFTASGFTPSNLPGTTLNLLLLLLLVLVLVLGCVLIGIEVAFYAALAAVPIMLVTLMMVAVESSREPDKD